MKGVGANVMILGLVSLFTDMSSQMVFPLIPLFLMTPAIGASMTVVGIIEGSAETVASLLKVFSGYWSDRIKRRKPFILLGYGLSSLAKPLFAFACVWQSVFLIRIVERVGKGVRNAPRDAIIAESSAGDVRGKAYGIHRAMDGIGSILGAVLAYILLLSLGFSDIFLLAGIPAFIAVLLILFVKEGKKVPSTDRPAQKSMRISFRELTPKLRQFIAVSTVFALGNFGYAFLLIRASEIGLSYRMVILLYITFYVVYTIVTIPAGMISDKIGRKPVIVVGYLLFGLTSLGLAVVTNLSEIVWLFVLYGVFYGMIDGVQRAFVVDLSPPDLKATALGAFHTATGLAALPASAIAGILWDVISPETAFLYGFVLSITAAALLLRFRE